MKKVRHSLYELVAKRNIQSKKSYSSRQGALLQVEFEDGSVGYADCHPWEEFGDLPLKVQLELLESGRCTRLTARSIHYAKIDAEARAKKINVLQSCKIPASHYFISELDHSALEEAEKAWGEGFTTFKIKLGKELSKEEELIKSLARKFPEMKLRLDFNSKLNRDQFISFLDKITSYRNNLDFVEDPFPFDYGAWRQIQETFEISLAADEHFKVAFGNPEAAKVLIMKPAVHCMKLVDGSQRLVVSSYLDHPIGQFGAAYIASKASNEVCGLLSHHAYQANPFSKSIKHQGPVLTSAEGTGFGFDDELKKLKFV